MRLVMAYRTASALWPLGNSSKITERLWRSTRQRHDVSSGTRASQGPVRTSTVRSTCAQASPLRSAPGGAGALRMLLDDTRSQGSPAEHPSSPGERHGH